MIKVLSLCSYLLLNCGTLFGKKLASTTTSQCSDFGEFTIILKLKME